MTLKIHSKRPQLPLDSLFCLPASSVFDKVSVLKYTGLAPSTRSSGTKVYHGSKQGSNYLRWILTQVTWTNVRKEPNGTVGNFYYKLKKKKGNAKASSKAIVAESAKLLRIVYWVLKEHRPYQS